MSDWMTTAEAVQETGYPGRSNVKTLCARHGITMRKERGKWLLKREEVEALADQMRYTADMKASGMRRCSRCREWKGPEGFYGPERYCILCCKIRKAESRKAEKRNNPEPEPPEEIITGAPAQPDDSLKYACMDRGFYARPIPRGLTKHEAFCPICEAPRCMLRRDLTPAEVMRLRVKGARVPTVETVTLPKTAPSSKGRTFASRK